MSAWDADAIDLVGRGFVEFAADRTGEVQLLNRGWVLIRTKAPTVCHGSPMATSPFSADSSH